MRLRITVCSILNNIRQMSSTFLFIWVKNCRVCRFIIINEMATWNTSQHQQFQNSTTSSIQSFSLEMPSQQPPTEKLSEVTFFLRCRRPRHPLSLFILSQRGGIGKNVFAIFYFSSRQSCCFTRKWTRWAALREHQNWMTMNDLGCFRREQTNKITSCQTLCSVQCTMLNQDTNSNIYVFYFAVNKNVQHHMDEYYFHSFSLSFLRQT